MNRYLLKPNEKATKNRTEYFVELGLYDFWLLSMGFISRKIPPLIQIDDIDEAYKLLKMFIAECGNTINIDLPDGSNSDYIVGIETEKGTMRLIWYTVDRAYKNVEDTTFSEEIVEVNQYIFGKNLEQQFGFTFDHLVLTPSYILIYSKERDIPEEIDNEFLKIDPVWKNLKIYDHQWGNYEHKSILQYRTRYYCNEGLVAVLWPKGSTRTFHQKIFLELMCIQRILFNLGKK